MTGHLTVCLMSHVWKVCTQLPQIPQSEFGCIFSHIPAPKELMLGHAGHFSLEHSQEGQQDL